MKRTLILLTSLLLLAVSGYANTINATSCSAAAVQAAITSAANGDTVVVPGGSCTWDAPVSIPSSLYITLSGGGGGTTTKITWGTTGNGALGVTAGTLGTTRITGFTFIGAEPNRSCPISITTSLSPLSTAFRMDNNILQSGGNEATGGGLVFVCQAGNGPGLFDHNKFTTTNGADEMLHFLGNGADDASGWSDVVTPGGPNMIFMEDNSFTCTSSTLASAEEGYYGARVVLRHNTFNNTQTEFHGGGGIGTRWWEVYANTFINANMCFRAGSGVVYNNTNAGVIFMLQEGSAAYPANYQIGRGQSESLYPAYVWGNGSGTGLNLNTTGCATPEANMVQLNRDVYNASTGAAAAIPSTCSTYQSYFATDTNTLYKCTAANTWSSYYTAYTYPHPLVTASGGGGTTTNYTLTVITPTGGTISCASGSYTSGTVVSCVASPLTGYTFNGWTGACSGTNPSCSITMSSAQSVGATFVSANISGKYKVNMRVKGAK